MRRVSAQRGIAAGLLIAVGVLLHGCGSRAPSLPGEQDGPPAQHRDMSHVPDAVPKAEPRSRGGNPASYVVFGKRYHTLSTSSGFTERGIASWYGTKFHGRRTSNGEVYDMYAMSAAHTRLPLPSYVEVVNLENKRRVVVRVNDRGPFHANRIIDLSYAAASRLGMLGKGTALVEIRAIDPRASASTTTDSTRRIPAADPPRPSAAAAVPQIYLQAGAFSDGGNAERLRLRLAQGLAHGVRVVPAPAAGGQVHRVQVGPLDSVEAVDQVSAQMHHFGVSQPLVVID